MIININSMYYKAKPLQLFHRRSWHTGTYRRALFNNNYNGIIMQLDMHYMRIICIKVPIFFQKHLHIYIYIIRDSMYKCLACD